jgi:tRNA(Ser,Leu) C12 N-acetylase TAN1
MNEWNVVVTVTPGPRHEQRVHDAMQRFGRFWRTGFKDLCVGRADDLGALLEGVRNAIAAGKPWAQAVGRVIPIDATFPFVPETLTESLKAAVAPLAARLADGSFCVRLERRGLVGEINSPEVERAVADHVLDLAQASGRKLGVSLKDPDFLLVIETIGTDCGVGLITRELRSRYPFVQVR